MTKTDNTSLPRRDQAIAMMASENITAYAAAKHFGIRPEAIYRRLKSLAETEDIRCPCCHQILPKSQQQPTPKRTRKG
jgi:DNA-directed RNA polymerase subunit RPC12/RpoP